MSQRRSARGSLVGIRTIAIVLIAVGVGLGALLVFGSVNETYTAWVANARIMPGTVLDRSLVSETVRRGQPASDNLITGAEIDAVVGKLVTSPLYAGDPIARSDFFVPVSPDGVFDPATVTLATKFSELIPAGTTPILIQGDPTSSFVSVGDQIDIYFVGDVSARKILTKTVLYAVPVPAIGAGSRPAGTQFFLDTTSQEAQDLIALSYRGELRIALVSPLAEATDETVESTDAWLSRTYKVTVGAAPSPVEELPPSDEPVDPFAPPSADPLTDPDAEPTPPAPSAAP